MTTREILAAWLKAHDYDGLCGMDCGCVLEDLMPCEPGWEAVPECEPGYKVPCPGPEKCEMGGDCAFHISTHKEAPR
jgi:hypothetical protein